METYIGSIAELHHAAILDKDRCNCDECFNEETDRHALTVQLGTRIATIEHVRPGSIRNG